MIGAFATHLITYLAVCGFLSLLWVLLGGGSVGELRHYVATPSDAIRRDFWPVWAWLTWGVVIVVHFAAVVGRLMQPSYWGRRRAEWQAVRDVGPVRGPERRWLVVMFTDLVDSTALNETLGDEAWSQIVVAHRDAVRSCMLEHDGIEVATQGDGFLVRFAAPAAGVACAAALQRRFEETRRGGAFVPDVRIGLHAGEAVEHGGDILGQVVNLAARVTGAAAPGEVLVTEPVADSLGGTVALADRGLVTLKGVLQPRHLLAVAWQPVELVLDDGSNIDLV